jgi:N utilization substance protein A
MAEVRLDNETLMHISLFEKITRTRVRDCVPMEDKIIFMVDNGWITKAVGKDGENVSRLRKALDKTIQIIEYSDDPQQFVASVFHPYEVESVELEMRGEQIHATVKVNPALKAKAIGKQGRNLKIFRDIISRHHNIQSVSVA